MEQNQNNEIDEMEKDLNQLEHELQFRYSSMGKSLLDLADLEQKKVNKLVDEIIVMRKKLAIAKQEIECDECMTFNPSDARYCKRCGKRLAQFKEKGE